jgi:hypothetical protein
VLIALAVALVGMLSYNGPFFSMPSSLPRGHRGSRRRSAWSTPSAASAASSAPWGVGVLKEQTNGYSAAMAAMGVAMLISGLIVVFMGRKISPARTAVSPAPTS